MTTKEAACAYLDAGLSVIPTDKPTKKPKVSTWAAFQQLPATKEQATEWFQNGAALAVICGKVSGNLEIIDFDKPGAAKEWADLLKSWNCGGILSKLVIEKSQRGGTHAAYRFSGEPQGNQKLALAADKTVKIETRGEGGYCLTAPTDGYSLKQGQWTDLPVLTADERDALLSAARYFDESPKEYVNRDQGRVGDDYNARASLAEIITPKGWVRASGTDLWTRPGKNPKEGHSASWNHRGNGHFVVFSSSAGIDPGAYDLFGLYARLHHGGDFKAAAIAASRSGYGETPRQTVSRVVERDPVDNVNRKWFTFDQIEEEEIKWVLEPYLPLGIGYTLIFGDSGIGKTTSVLSFLAKFSQGIHPITGDKIEPLRSIILSAEDSAKHVIRPRLRMLGANMRNIMSPEEFLEDGTPNPLRLDAEGMEALRAKVREFEARLVMIDPLTAYFDGDSMNDRLQARTWARRIHELSVQELCCPLVVHHVNKATGMQGRYRASGSQDFFDGCRSALMAVRAGTDSDDYALVHEKHNLTPQGEALGYTFNRETGFEWTGTSDLTSDIAAAAIAEQHVGPKELERCKKWILEQLESGPVLSKDLKKGAIDDGFSKATYDRGRAALSDQIKGYQEQPGVSGSPWWTKMRTYYWNQEKEDPYAD